MNSNYRTSKRGDDNNLGGKVFDITKERPKVLILGNGISKSDGNRSWSELINDLSRNGMRDVNLPAQTPYSIKATIMTDPEDKIRFAKYQSELSNDKYKYVDNDILELLMKIPFDAVLTTNYTYEIEYVFDSRYPGLSNPTKRKYSTDLRKQGSKTSSERIRGDTRYLISTFNRIEKDNYPLQDIWHIHGEQRRKSSMILTHNEYVRLMFKIVEYFNSIGNKYEEKAGELEFISWLDYFVLGELYIIGQGFDFSEFDLWWLLGRRQRENINKIKMPTIRFYSPNIKEGEVIVDRVMSFFKGEDVVFDKKNKELGVVENGNRYREFYEYAVQDIKKSFDNK